VDLEHEVCAVVERFIASVAPRVQVVANGVGLGAVSYSGEPTVFVDDSPRESSAVADVPR
jgi:hypothetical protein